jgi:hypothetical protein
MVKFSLTQLKKELDKKTKQELIKEISTLYKTFPQVKEYYQVQHSSANEVLKKYQEIIEKEFVEGKTRGLPKARLNVAKKAITDFKKITKEPELLAELMFTFVESISNFNSDFGVDEEDFYVIPEDMFEVVLQLIKDNNLLSKYEQRAHEIVENATEGWGHFDSLKERYEDVYGKFMR